MISKQRLWVMTGILNVYKQLQRKNSLLCCQKWTISKFCRREWSLVLYAKNGNQASLASIFNWVPDLFVTLHKSRRPSISSPTNWGWSPNLAHLGGLWVGKHHGKFKMLLTITYYCLSASPKKAAEHDKDSWLTMLPAFILEKRDSCIKIWNRVILRLLGTLTFSDSHLFSLPQHPGLIIRMQPVVEGWETWRLASKNPLPWVTKLSLEESSLTTLTMPESPCLCLSYLWCQWQMT